MALFGLFGKKKAKTVNAEGSRGGREDIRQAQVDRDGLFREGTAAFDSGKYNEALGLFEKAAEAGHRGAQLRLAEIYGKDDVVPSDKAKAFKWCKMAAEQGEPAAEYRLGFMYLNGDGTEKSAEEAFKWIERAAENGYIPAWYKCGLMYMHGQGTAKDAEKGKLWLKKAMGQREYPELSKKAREMYVFLA